MKRLLLLPLFGIAVLPALASQNADTFLAQLWEDASNRGIQRNVFDRAMSGYAPIPEVTRQSGNQAEFVEGVGDYVEKRVNPRIANGRQRLAEWSDTLAEIERRYGVSAEVIIAIWGVETNFGTFVGGENAVHALATLTERNYRADYFREELLTAFAIIQQGHISPENMVGSWAGAMGQTQFMPSSFTNFAVDFNGDGRKDIWTSIPDALASAANYLKASGWRPNETWGYEVALPAGFDFAAAGSGQITVGEWEKRGITRVSGRPFPRPGDRAELYLPAGAGGPAFLTLPNFQVIKRYNNSNSYALSVGHLADRILGGGSFVADWPQGPILIKSELAELQTRLNRLGYDVGEPDGVAGSMTRAGIAAYQAKAGIPADGYPTPQLLRRLQDS